MLQPNNILPDNSTLLTHFIGRDSLRPKPPVDRLRADPEMIRKLIDGEKILHCFIPPFLPELVG